MTMQPVHTLLVVHHLTLEVFCHVVRIYTGISNIAFDSRVILPLVSNSLEERGASGARATEHQAHLAGL